MTFFDHPWPSDLRLKDGTLDLTGYPNPRLVPIIDTYITTMTGKLDGFSPAAAGYLRFSTALDPKSLPADAVASTDFASSVQLIDIDPDSPERGRRHLIDVKFRAEEGVYYPTNVLAWMPALGFPLRPHTRYALVVTDAVRGVEQGMITKSKELAEVLGEVGTTSAATKAAKDALAPALSEINASISLSRVVNLAVFRTSDPTEELFAARDNLMSSFPAPDAQADAWVVGGTKDAFTEYLGVYGPSPNYQEGKLPFAKPGDGGDFHSDKGIPAVVDSFDLRFSLTVPNSPNCPMPENGYPIVLYAHGTGGDFRSYARDGTARDLAEHCMASMGIDQIFHGRRPGAPKDGDEATISLLFFNVENVVAARTNSRQAALDEVQRARLFTETKIQVPAAVSVTGNPIRFDGSKLSFFGHSQGGLNGPLFLAADSQANAAVLSGSSSVMAITLTEKTEPAPSIAELVKTVFLGLKTEEAAELDLFHPALSLAQTLVDTTDPLHYARFIVQEPRLGSAPKSIYMTEGINPDGTGDSYSPPRGIEAHALAIGLPLVGPAVLPYAEAGWDVGPRWTEIPDDDLQGNLGGGAATGVIVQWPVAEGSDGHFVVFDVPDARAQSTLFLQSAGEFPIPKVKRR